MSDAELTPEQEIPSEIVNGEEVKSKLVRFFFMDRELFMGHSSSIELVKEDRRIKYYYKRSLKNAKKRIFTMRKWNKFIDKIFSLNIQEWKSRYINEHICDGGDWRLEMAFEDLPGISCYGRNEYPNNWEAFENTIYKYFPKMKLPHEW